MKLSSLIVYSLTGGLFTTVIVVLEESGRRTLSGLVTLIPVFTLVAYLFIGQTAGNTAVSQHAKWVLAGTLVTWVPYMLGIAYLAPKIGSQKAHSRGADDILCLGARVYRNRQSSETVSMKVRAGRAGGGWHLPSQWL
jgi:uncharacterized membrane protein (GlpM family)